MLHVRYKINLRMLLRRIFVNLFLTQHASVMYANIINVQIGNTYPMIEIDKVFLKRYIAVHIVRIVAVRASSRTIEATAAIELTIMKIKSKKRINKKKIRVHQIFFSRQILLYIYYTLLFFNTRIIKLIDF